MNKYLFKILTLALVLTLITVCYPMSACATETDRLEYQPQLPRAVRRGVQRVL